MESVMEFGSATTDSQWVQEPHKDILKRNVTWVKYLWKYVAEQKVTETFLSAYERG